MHLEAKRDFFKSPLLSTGGYNDHFLRFVAHTFNAQIVKCRDFLSFVIHAIDYLDKFTNDAFFQLQAPLEKHSSSPSIQIGKIKKMGPKQRYFSLKEELYPYMLVNLRSGATFTRVDSKTEYRRLCGTTIGGSLYWGILKLLKQVTEPTEALTEAIHGDSTNIDMSVGDIYGGDY